MPLEKCFHGGCDRKLDCVVYKDLAIHVGKLLSRQVSVNIEFSFELHRIVNDTLEKDQNKAGRQFKILVMEHCN